MKTFIYGLYDPRTQELKYIGKANNIQSRLKDHMLDYRDCPIERMCWIDDLKRNKLKPIAEVIDEILIEEWKMWEEFYIGYFKSLGISLFNKRAGNGLTYKVSTTYRPGNIPHNKNKIKMGNKYV